MQHVPEEEEGAQVTVPHMELSLPQSWPSSPLQQTLLQQWTCRDLELESGGDISTLALCDSGTSSKWLHLLEQSGSPNSVCSSFLLVMWIHSLQLGRIWVKGTIHLPFFSQLYPVWAWKWFFFLMSFQLFCWYLVPSSPPSLHVLYTLSFENPKLCSTDVFSLLDPRGLGI